MGVEGSELRATGRTEGIYVTAHRIRHCYGRRWGGRQRALIRCCFGVKVCILQRFNGKRVLFKIAAASA